MRLFLTLAVLFLVFSASFVSARSVKSLKEKVLAQSGAKQGGACGDNGINCLLATSAQLAAVGAPTSAVPQANYAQTQAEANLGIACWFTAPPAANLATYPTTNGYPAAYNVNCANQCAVISTANADQDYNYADIQADGFDVNGFYSNGADCPASYQCACVAVGTQPVDPSS